MTNHALGTEVKRKDGALKVTGKAMYSADVRLPRMAYATLVLSSVPAGKIRGFDSAAAMAAPGVIAIVTHQNALRLKDPGSMATGGEYAEKFFPLQDPDIHFWGQYVAVVVADTQERADEAAALFRTDYEREKFEVDLEDNPTHVFEPKQGLGQKLQMERGDFAGAIAKSEAVVSQTYRTSYVNHNAMEPHVTVADWTSQGLTIYEPTQWVMGLRSVVSKALDMKAEEVHIISPFVGGGFGSKGFAWPHTLAAAMASRASGRPVKLVLTRAQMFTSVGHRAPTRQEVQLGATKDGILTAIRHDTFTQSSIKSEYTESCGLATSMLYRCANAAITHRVAHLNTGTPCPMRAPGEAPGTFALESAMDELAEKLGLDPIDLRIRNHAEEDPEKKRPWSSKHLIECYNRGAELFGWKERSKEPRSNVQGGEWVGHGMATATYPANKRDGSAAVRLFTDGHVVVRSATHDLGTGTYTSLAQIAADALEMPVDRVSCEIGDSLLPPAGVSGGSSTSASVGPMVHEAALKLKKKIEGFASAAEAAASTGKGFIEAEAETGKLASAAATLLKKGPSTHSFGAQFAEVRVNIRTRQIKVSRFVSVIDAGKIMNPLTARSQIQGGIIWGIGMALLERTDWDYNLGHPVTRNLADYLVPVNADIPDIKVEFTDYPDMEFNSIGVRGIGEIGITGTVAAVANAVYNATGIRVRDLPLTLDKILA
ncbi:MAG TPA: xanthine dehydrogenase family protein molybdopterin-binding subunit [Opitutaceae bacterium]|jgi:xanthine dehydrogenase YagR molybdenum-binding subunit|nr:xanthine dehydrogenase family protein molybdopterin-binding subunit [Opitutaceae bacterium]